MAQRPPLSFGTYTVRGDTCRDAVIAALRCGYRRIDTAAVYKNEEEVGAALRAVGIPRSELRVTTKLAPQDQKGAAAAIAALRASLKRLGLDYVDCYLMHWPGTGRKKVKDPANIALRCESWRGMCEAKAMGLTREVGVCNFSVRHFESLAAAQLPLPQVHQLELHPLCRQREVVAWCREKQIAVEAYSPLGSGEPALLQHPLWVKTLGPAPADETAAEQQSKRAQPTAEPLSPASSPTSAPHADPSAVAQALLCWSMREGYLPVVRSTNPRHIAADLVPATMPDPEFIRLADAAEAIASSVAPDADDTHFCWFGDAVV